jgi:hypothetical protein
MNHAVKASILRGIMPKKLPPLTNNSIPFAEKPIMAKVLVIKAITETIAMVKIDLILTGMKGMITIPDNKTIIKDFKSRPINSLPSNTIIL